MELNEMEKKLLFQVEGDYQTKILNELYMTVRYSNNSEQREAAEGLMAKLRVLSNAECMDLVKDIQKNYRLPYPARTIGEKIAEARQQSGAEKLKGHDIMALERFDPEVKHMIVFDVLNGVTESDLMALAEKNNGSMSMIPQEESCNCTEKCEAGKVNTGCPVCKNDLNGCKGKEKPAETEKPAEPEKPKKETGSVGTILFILAALLAVGGIGYYVKIVRPKQQAEDDAEFEDDGYGEGFDPDEAYGEPEYLSEDDFDDKDSK